MTGADFVAILPFLVLTGAAVLVMLVIAVRRNHGVTAITSMAGLALALAAIAPAASVAPRAVTPLFVVDAYALFYTGLILAAALAVTLLSYGYLGRRTDVPREEYYLLLLLATLGAATLAAGTHFAALLLGIEILSVSLLAMIAYPRTLARPVEAGVKYLVLAGVSSAFLLFGVALIYAETGSLSFGATAPLFARDAGAAGLYPLAGIAMILTGIGFKLSLVPFHMWAPDVYEGAPAPVAAFVAVVSKTAVFALLLRYFVAADAFASEPLLTAVATVAILSMLAGNLLALLQNNIKRLLAYSSIAHLGYALVPFLAGGPLAVEAISYYLVAYAITTVGAFGVVALLSPPAGRDADSIADYRGLFWARPWLAGVFTAMLLSLAGIPLTVGFIAKFYAVTPGVGAGLTLPVAALVIGSIIGLYYYLRVIVAMYLPATGTARPRPEAPRLGSAVMAVLAILLVGLGVYPGPLVAMIRTSVADLAANQAPPVPAARVSAGSP